MLCLALSARGQSGSVDTKLRLDVGNAATKPVEDRQTKFLKKIMLQRVLRDDSTYLANGINMQNAFDRPRTTPMSSPEGSKIIKQMLIKDGLATADRPVKFDIIPYILYVDGKMIQSATLGRKYGEFWQNFLRTDPDNQALERRNKEKTDFVFNHIVVQMLTDGIVRDVYPLSFVLNNETFKVNGKEQPAVVYQRYFDMFIKPSNGPMSYGMVR
ncbi:hypothetical protein GCM10028827_37360 [Mucilaginibacter myungsuensis]